MSDTVNKLVEMGFNKERAELAVLKTSGADVQEAMDWLLTHEEELDNTPEVTDVPPEPSTEENVVPEENQAALIAKSIKCEQCGKLFKNQTEVEFHAAKSGHDSFSQSTEEKKPLTEEEKKEQLAKIEAKLKQRRLEREAREKLEELEREKNRIKSGKEIHEAKKKHDEQKIKKMLEQRKREKEEEILARQRVKEQIEQDKLRRKEKYGGVATEPAISKQESEISKPIIAKDYSQVKLQIRLTNGEALTQTFSAKEPLSAVRVYIEMNRTDPSGPFSLMTTHPRKVFNSDDYEKPLDLLGLAPSAVVIVTKS